MSVASTTYSNHSATTASYCLRNHIQQIKHIHKYTRKLSEI